MHAHQAREQLQQIVGKVLAQRSDVQYRSEFYSHPEPNRVDVRGQRLEVLRVWVNDATTAGMPAYPFPDRRQ